MICKNDICCPVCRALCCVFNESDTCMKFTPGENPGYGGVFLRKIKNREKLQDADHMMRFASAKDITDFEKLDAFKDSHEAHYNALLDEFYEGVDRQNLLYEMIDAWDRFKPYSDIKKESLSLKGLAKLKYDISKHLII